MIVSISWNKKNKKKNPMARKPEIIKEPKISLQLNGATIQVWIGDAKQVIHVADRRSFIFGGDKTASLVYEVQSAMHSATEYPIDHAPTWQWMEKWMERGLIAQGHLEVKNAKHWQAEGDAIKEKKNEDRQS